MRDTDYAFCVARIRAFENKLLSKQDIASLIEMKSLTDAFAFLSQKGYADGAANINEMIIRQGQQLNELLMSIVPDEKELDALYILNDFFNIKVFVKCAIEELDVNDFLLYPSSIHIDNFNKNGSFSDFSFLKDDYRTVAEKAYNIALKSDNGKFSDAVVDQAAINALCTYSRMRNSGLLGEVCAFLADTANIKTALRCATTNQDSDYINAALGDCCKLNRSKLISATLSGFDSVITYLETTVYQNGARVYAQKPSGFEKWCDDKITEITSRSVYTSFGFAPVVSYFYRKNLEIKTVRMILSAIKSDVDKDIIRGRMREIYA